MHEAKREDTPRTLADLAPKMEAGISPKFAALPALLTGTDRSITSPAMTGLICTSDGHVLYSKSDEPGSGHDHYLNPIEEVERNLRGWAESRGADEALTARLIAQVPRSPTGKRSPFQVIASYGGGNEGNGSTG